MQAETIDFRLVGTKRLLMHNGITADPLHPVTKALARLTSKKPKTESDHLEISRVEWNGSLWLDEGRPCIPAEALTAAFVSAAKLTKSAPEARAGLVVEENAILEYEGPRDLDELWADPNFRLRTAVRIGRSRMMRTRPRFDDWSVRFTAHFLPTLLDRDEVVRTYQTAGFQRGLGDWRPQNGTFAVEVL